MRLHSCIYILTAAQSIIFRILVLAVWCGAIKWTSEVCTLPVGNLRTFQYKLLQALPYCFGVCVHFADVVLKQAAW